MSMRTVNPWARARRGCVTAAAALLALTAPGLSPLAAAQTGSERSNALKRMSLDDLFALEVTLVSKQPEKLTETASAIQVITGEDIRRSGATNLAEALRLVPNVRVAQLNAFAWVVSARGFSGAFTNKLLVMIDGRSVYTPLFAGVLWDIQNPLLEDIDHIEVVSGPGGSVWGANAVNGVINVITKKARDSAGLYAAGTGGTFVKGGAAVRYGHATERFAWRAYAHRVDRDNTAVPGGGDYQDAWNITQAGIRADWTPSSTSTVNIDAAAYQGEEHVAPSDIRLDGQYVLGRWTRSASETSTVSLQMYFDRTWRRDPPSTITNELQTTDIELQQRRALGSRHQAIWGGGFRLSRDETIGSTPFVGFVPTVRNMPLYSAFAQDEIAVVPNAVKLIVGTRVQHNVYAGFDVQPSARIAWTPNEQGTVWGAVSRAVRAPSRIDVDYHIPAMVIPVGTPGVNGGPNFDSEKVVAYELGYRAQPSPQLSLSLATFYNQYRDLYSVESVNGTPTFEIMNGTEGESWGVEISETYQPVTWWRLRGGYTYFRKDLRNKPGRVYDFSTLGNDPNHQVMLQSILDLPGGFELDVAPRHASSLPSPAVPSYTTVDARLAKQIKGLELALVGQSLGQARHSEFGLQDIRRSVYAKVTWRGR